VRAVASIEQALHELFQDIDQEAFDRLAARLDEAVELADEITGEWLRGKRRVAAYLRASKGVVTNIHSRISAVSARWLTESVGLATFSAQQHYSLDVLQHNETLTGSALFALSDDRPARLLLLHLGTSSPAGHDADPEQAPAASDLPRTPSTLGERLRRERLDARLSLRALAEQAGVSASLLSQLERGIVEPNLSSVRRIASALGTSVGHLADASNEGDAEEIEVTRVGARRLVDLPDSPLRAELLVRDGGRRLEVWIGILPAATDPHLRSRQHPRDEFILVLEGRMQLQQRGRETWLESGDAVYIRAGAEHRLASGGNEPLRFLSVIPLAEPRPHPPEYD
jgi:transcriptional regulator with XRE-family HTH domain